MNIYVGNISYDMTEEDLRELFAAYGEVESTKIITDRETGRSKGFGFVEMENDNEAEAAIEELNNKEIQSRNIKVDKARPKRNNNRRYR